MTKLSMAKATKAAVLAVMALITVFAVAVARRFHPPHRIVLSSPCGIHRLLAVAPDSADGTVLVSASDWPHTLFAPFVLGDAAWPEKYASANCHWSKDGTLAVWLVQGVDEKTKRYEAAYDFSRHHGMDLQQYAWDQRACDQAIASLVLERGGVNPLASDIPSLNSGLYR